MTLKNNILYLLLYLVPKNFLSSLVGRLVSIRLPKSLAMFVNRNFARIYNIDIDEAEKRLEEYSCLQEFFSRHLRPGARAIAANSNIITPCDGKMTIASRVHDGTLIQVKGKHYSVDELLAGSPHVTRFVRGHYATLYLSPRDYHRFHVPITGTIIETIYVRGTLWPVNPWSVNTVDKLFCRNERVITLITDDKTRKLLAHIAVGATMVGKIALEYCRLDDNYEDLPHGRRIIHDPISVEKGQALGTFLFGSTIILLMEHDLIAGFRKDAPCAVKMGEALA